MKIIKVPITEENKELYRNRCEGYVGKTAWEDLLSSCECLTSGEFWKNEWEEYERLKYSWNYKDAEKLKYWFIIDGEPNSIADELVKLKLGENDECRYPWAVEHHPEDLSESRTDWEEMKDYADEMYYFIHRLYDYI